MADPIRQLLSQTSYVADGSQTVWNFSFSGGYIDKSHVKAKYLDAARVAHQIAVTPGMFLGQYQLNITPPIAAGSELVIYRDTPKEGPLVDFIDAASLTEASLDLSAKQGVFVAAESSDGWTTIIEATTTQAVLAAAANDAAGASRDAAAVSAANALTSENAASGQAALATNAAATTQTLRDSIIATQGAIGYLPPVAYAAGLSMTLPAQTVSYSGQAYAPLLSALPFTTSGAFEVAKFRLIQGVAAVDLAAPNGSSLLGFDFGVLPAAINSIQWAVALFGMNGVPVLRYILPGQWAAIAAGTSTYDATAAIQAAIDSTSGPVNVILPAGKLRKTGTIYLRRKQVRIIGQGFDVSTIEHVDAAGSIGFSGDTNTVNSLLTYSACALLNFSMNGGAGLGPAATDPTICVDLTSFSYGNFDISITNKRANGIMYYGQGNNGASPYYNRISAPLLLGDGAGGTNYTQIGFKFVAGAFTGGSNGPNANIITNIGRAASLLGFCDLQAGLGNLFSNISVESLNDYCFRFNQNTPVQTGTSTGGGSSITLRDTSKAWVVNAYVNAGVKIASGTGAEQVRIVSVNSATALTVREPWAVLPDSTSTYEIYAAKATGNKAVNVRMEGLSTLNPDFIYALPGTDKTNVSQCEVISLGAGLYVRDESGSPRNSWYGGSKLTMTHAVPNIGPSANINIYERGGALGGVHPAGSYVMEWLKVATTTASGGDVLTVTLDVGGNAPRSGSDMSLVANIPNGETQSMAMPVSTAKIPRDGTNRGIFLNVMTGPAFSATADAQVTWCATLI